MESSALASQLPESRISVSPRRGHLEDVCLDNETVGVFVRSPHAHARIVEIDRDLVTGLPSILVYTGEDLRADNIGDVPCGADVNNIDAHPALPAPPRPGDQSGATCRRCRGPHRCRDQTFRRWMLPTAVDRLRTSGRHRWLKTV